MTKEELLLSLSVLLSEPLNKSILSHDTTIQNIRSQLKVYTTDEEEFDITSKIKARVQAEANHALDAYNGVGAIVAATGVGKSKIAIDRVLQLSRDRLPILVTEEDWKKEYASKPVLKGLLVVPTEKLRDEGWANEWAKWGNFTKESFKVLFTATCYASLKNYSHTDWDLIILDEFHNITPNNAEFFFNKGNSWKSLIALSAVKPENKQKITLLKSIGIFPVYEVTLDQAIKLGITAPYEITLINMPLDDTMEYIEAGREGSKFFITETRRYRTLTGLLYSNPEWARMQRMTFINQLRSKTNAAKWLLEGASKDHRMIIFCGTKKQADELCTHRYYSRPTKPKALVQDKLYKSAAIDKYNEKLKEYEEAILHYTGELDLILFQRGEINRISCCDALNEGHNIADDLDMAFIVQMYSKKLDLVQRLGRILRFRPNHIGKIIILYVRDTIDKEWTYKAIANLDASKIRDISIEDIAVGKEKIFLTI